MAYTGSRLADIETNVATLANDSKLIDRTKFLAMANMCLRELSRRGCFTKQTDVTTVASQDTYSLPTTLERIAYVDGTAVTNLGGGRTGIPATGQPFSIGETVTLAGFVNYNGSYQLQSQTTANLLAIIAICVAETPPTSAYARGPANYGRILSIRYNDEEEPMHPAKSWLEFESLRQGNIINTPDSPCSWVVMPEETDKLYVWPAPSASITGGLHVLHTWRPQPFDETYNYTPPVPEMFDDIFTAYVLAKRFDRDYASSGAQGKQGQYTVWFEEMATRLKSSRAHFKGGFTSYR